MKNNRSIIVAAAIIISIIIVYLLRDIVSYVLIAWVLSLVGRPVVSFLERILTFKKFKPGKALLSLLTMLIFLLAITVVFWLFVPLVIVQAENLSKIDLNSLNNTLHIPLNEFKNWLASYHIIEPNVDVDQKLVENLKNLIEPAKIGVFFSSAVGAAGNALVTVSSVMFILFFFLKDQHSFDNFLKSIVPEKYESYMLKAIQNIAAMLRGYFTGIIAQVTILSILLTVALSILGLKNALLIAFFGALMNVIPYLGIIIAMLFGVMITISSNLDLDFSTQVTPMIIKVLLAFAGTQLIDNLLVQPYVYSKSVKAHPLEIFLVIMIAGKIGGVLAMLIAVPVYTSLKVIAKVFFNQWRIVQHVTKGMGDLE